MYTVVQSYERNDAHDISSCFANLSKYYILAEDGWSVFQILFSM